MQTKSHTEAYTYTLTKKEKYINIIAPKVQLLNLGWFVVYSGIPQMQGTSSWLWSFNPLFLSLLGEISLSLLCSHSSWGSALDLAPPLRVGRLRASVLCSDRTGLKEQLLRGLLLTQAVGREGYGCSASLQRQRPVWRCTSLRRAVRSPGEVVPGSRDPGSGGLHRLPGGEVWIVTCAAHRLLGGGSSSLSVSCPSLGSVLIATARARLWSCFKRCSESPLLAHQETKRPEIVSCLFGSSRLFPGLPPGQLWRTSPFRLCSSSQPQSSPWDPPSKARASAPSPRPPRRVSREASRAGEWWSAPILCAGIPPLCPPHPCCCALLRGSEVSPLHHLQSPPAKGLPSVWKPFLHSSVPLVQVPSMFFCLCFVFFLLPYPGTWGSFLPFGRSEVFCQRSVCVL